MRHTLGILVLLMSAFSCNTGADNTVAQKLIDATVDSLAARYPDADAARLRRGVELTAKFWLPADGTPAEFQTFCIDNYCAPADRPLLLQRFAQNLEAIYGRFGQISARVQFPIHVDEGKPLPVDETFAAWSPAAHLNDDWFGNKLALTLHLNFPCYTLDERNTLGFEWTDDENAAVNLGLNFGSRTPGELIKKMDEISARAEIYISNYNIYMHRLLDEQGARLFPENLRLISHWGLRDELKANYADTTPQGVAKQRLIYDLMLRIINQEIPAAFINSDDAGDYCPTTGKLFNDGVERPFERENDVRYDYLLKVFKASKAIDPFSPLYPDAIKRAFDGGLEMTFDEVETLFVNFLSAPVGKDVTALIRQRLGRDLQPCDIWYDGFKTRSAYSDADLSAITAQRYPSAKALEQQLPDILRTLGFSAARADEICRHIAVDAARGSGHAWGAAMKGDTSRLRVRVPETGFNYNGFNIAMHEFGHNVEQTISMYNIDNFLNTGIPNTAFTEALAFVFQKRDLFVLGLDEPNPAKQQFATLDNYWNAFEIMGVALVDMYTWKWMYANPDATPAQLRAAVVGIATDVWNKYYAPIIGVSDSPILAVYSHTISYPLYLAAYPTGHLIEFQLEQQFAGKNLADEIDRIFRIGRRTPVVWMTRATGSKLSAEPFLKATAEAVQTIINNKY